MPFIRRIETIKNYTLVENECLNDKELDISERGLLVTMLSIASNPNWKSFSGIGLTSILPCGKAKVFSSLKKLEAAGYLRRTRIYKNGKVSDWSYEFCGKPIFREAESQENKPQDLDTENREVVQLNLDTDFQEVENLEVENR